MNFKYELLPVRDKNWDKIAKRLYKALVYKQYYEILVEELSDKLKELSNKESSRGSRYAYIRYEYIHRNDHILSDTDNNIHDSRKKSRPKKKERWRLVAI